MQISVFQILSSGKDKDRVRFENYKRTMEWSGKIDPSIYDQVLEIEISAKVKEGKEEEFLEYIFRELNEGVLSQFRYSTHSGS